MNDAEKLTEGKFSVVKLFLALSIASIGVKGGKFIGCHKKKEKSEPRTFRLYQY